MTVEEIIARAAIAWMDAFAASAVSELEPSTDDWRDYAHTEKAVAKFAARDIILSLARSGFVIVPQAATEQMCGAGLDPVIEGVGPMYAAMIGARPK